jgi:hypothetical protein
MLEGDGSLCVDQTERMHDSDDEFVKVRGFVGAEGVEVEVGAKVLDAFLADSEDGAGGLGVDGETRSGSEVGVRRGKGGCKRDWGFTLENEDGETRARFAKGNVVGRP